MTYILFFLPKIIMVAIKDIVYFPIWWYSFGAWEFIIGIKNFLIGQERSLAIRIWIKNIFVPMYAQRDWQGRLISFFVRLVQIILRSILLLLYFILSILAFLAWLGLPFYIIYQISLHIIS